MKITLVTFTESYDSFFFFILQASVVPFHCDHSKCALCFEYKGDSFQTNVSLVD